MKVETLFEKLLFTTVKIETDYANSSGSGTGFFFQYTHGDMLFQFIVTNKHVVSGGHRGHLTFTRSKDKQPVLGDGFRLTVEPDTWTNGWFGHPDPNIDIAILPAVPMISHMRDSFGVEVFTQFTDETIIPSAEALSTLNPLEAVTFVGYPNGLWDSKNLIPIMRRGTTATPLQLDFDGEPKFLIDASVFGGSSGSPVFILDHGTYTHRNGVTHVGSRIFLTGVIAAVYQKTDHNAVVPIPIPTQFQAGVIFNQMIDLGIVFKSNTIVETVKAFLAANGFH